MKKKGLAPGGISWKLHVIVVSLTLTIVVCMLPFLSLHRFSPSHYSQIPSSRRSLHSNWDSITLHEGQPNPKVAFLFLARRHLPLDFVWKCFFQNADTANYSIYIHSEPGFVFNESTTRSRFFHDRQLKNSIKVGWGEASMIGAERLLLKEALKDSANTRFVLLSESCIPLYNFSYIYTYLTASPRSFVDSFLDKKERRYNPNMALYIPMSKWRKGSQWITLIRKHAEVVADDDVVFPVFKMFCKKRYNCIPDEHYVQTLLAMHDSDGELERRTITYTEWNQSASNMDKNSWHPMTFSYADAGPDKIKRIKDIDNVYYDTEYRTEWCHNNSTLVPCFLFARKFSRGAAMHLLSGGVISQFDASALMDPTP
ncbi:glycosyltransferase BC10-like [Solanum stenotomum]|uniref:glycosyltransferase BC10-like n=1 Tax=Solanum stenotomum TaxID=172797 RepID=UPI0020D14E59|nr:glycosyltransferase BC10-like [Solanum stenotomum]